MRKTNIRSNTCELDSRRHTNEVADLKTLLREAREKTAAEATAREIKASLSQIDDELVALERERDHAKRRVGLANGLLGRFCRDRSADLDGQIMLQSFDAAIATLEARRQANQKTLAAAQQNAHGVQLVRVELGVEMRRRTEALAADDPGRRRLTELDQRRETLLAERKLASTVATMAQDLMRLADHATQLDDGSTEGIYVDLRSASQKQEHFSGLIQPTAWHARAVLQDRLEGFSAVEGAIEKYQSLQKIAALVISDVAVEPDDWLHEVGKALADTVEACIAQLDETRSHLVSIDDERLSILNR